MDKKLLVIPILFTFAISSGNNSSNAKRIPFSNDNWYRVNNTNNNKAAATSINKNTNSNISNPVITSKGGYFKSGDNKKQIVMFGVTFNDYASLNDSDTCGIYIYSDAGSTITASLSTTNISYVKAKEGRFYCIYGENETIVENATYYAKGYVINNGTTYYSSLISAKGNYTDEYILPTTSKITVNATTGGTVSGGGNYSSGDSCTVVATPSEGYAFDGWYENDTKISGANASYTFTVSGSRTLTAKFDENFYTKVEYIQTSGTQCIDTGFRNTSYNFKVEIEACLLAPTGTGAIYGVETVQATSESQCYIPEYDLSVGNRWVYHKTSPTITVSANKYKYVFDIGNKKGSVGSTTFTYNDLGNISNAYGNHALSCYYNAAEKKFDHFSSMKIYECKIWQDNVLVRDFIPCVLNIDITSTLIGNVSAKKGDYGMWDLVGNKFYGNSGTGSFIHP